MPWINALAAALLLLGSLALLAFLQLADRVDALDNPTRADAPAATPPGQPEPPPVPALALVARQARAPEPEPEPALRRAA